MEFRRVLFRSRQLDLAIVHRKGAFPVTVGAYLRAYKRRKENSRARATKKSSRHHVHRSTFHLITPLVPNRPEPPFQHFGRCSEAPGRSLTFPHKPSLPWERCECPSQSLTNL